jgi:hypothetical protein
VQGHRAQGQRTVGVVDDRDLARAAGRDELRRGVQQQPVGGVDRDEFGRLDVGSTPELLENAGRVGDDQTPGRPTGQLTPVEFTGQ